MMAAAADVGLAEIVKAVPTAARELRGAGLHAGRDARTEDAGPSSERAASILHRSAISR